MRYTLLALAVSLLPISLYAAADSPTPLPLSTQERAGQIQKVIGGLENLKILVEQDVLQTTNECMLAIGNPEFCSCIANNRPGSINFSGYVQIVTRTKMELQYDQLDPENKKMVDTARAARDKCVNWKNKGTH